MKNTSWKTEWKLSFTTRLFQLNSLSTESSFLLLLMHDTTAEEMRTEIVQKTDNLKSDNLSIDSQQSYNTLSTVTAKGTGDSRVHKSIEVKERTLCFTCVMIGTQQLQSAQYQRGACDSELTLVPLLWTRQYTWNSIQYTCRTRHALNIYSILNNCRDLQKCMNKPTNCTTKSLAMWSTDRYNIQQIICQLQAISYVLISSHSTSYRGSKVTNIIQSNW